MIITQGHIHVLENFAWGDAARTVARLHQVVALFAMMFAAEGIDEGKCAIELAGADEKPGAIDLPRANRLSHVLPP